MRQAERMEVGREDGGRPRGWRQTERMKAGERMKQEGGIEADMEDGGRHEGWRQDVE